MRRHVFLSLALAALSPFLVIPGGAARPASDPEPTTPIRHLIVLMQENHSFDNYFGTFPGADGIPPGTCLPIDPGDPLNAECVEPFPLGDMPVEDLDHSRRTFRLQYNEGRMDGFVSALLQQNQDGRLAMGFYDDRDLPYYWNLAEEYVLFDRFFSSAGAGSFLNHVYWISASPGPGKDRPTREGLGDFSTIFDRLQASGISWKFYIQKYDPSLDYHDLVEGAPRPPQVEWVPLMSMDRYLQTPELFRNIVDLDEYYDDLRSGVLPAVSYVKIIGASEHPPGSLQAGQRATRSMIQALMQNEAWESSAFLLVYDDWGGWFDHVAPPQVDDFGYGFRVPALLVSPYARRGFVDHTTLDYASILRFIEDNWELQPLTARDALANSFASGFDFASTPRAPRLTPAQRYVGEGDGGVNPILIQASYMASLAATAGLLAWAAWFRRGTRQAGRAGQDGIEAEEVKR